MERNGSFMVLPDEQCFENIYGLCACISLNEAATLLVLETKMVLLIKVWVFFMSLKGYPKIKIKLLN